MKEVCAVGVAKHRLFGMQNRRDTFRTIRILIVQIVSSVVSAVGLSLISPFRGQNKVFPAVPTTLRLSGIDTIIKSLMGWWHVPADPQDSCWSIRKTTDAKREKETTQDPHTQEASQGEDVSTPQDNRIFFYGVIFLIFF